MKGLLDTTLREGEQGIGVYLSDCQRLHIFENLCLSGIEEIEVGVSAPRNKGLAALFAACRLLANKKDKPPRLALWSRCRADDIDLAEELQPDVLSLCVPVSDLHLREKLRIERPELLELLSNTLRKIRGKFPYISVGFEDASRADPHFLEDSLHISQEYSVDRIRLADTVGILSPAGMQSLVGLARQKFSGDIGVHCHNDFGMATANCIAALESGADWADTTLLGIGERAGNARLEEVAAYLHINGLQAGKEYDLPLIKELCLYIAAVTGRQVAANKAIVGSGLFTCESGLHAAAIHSAPATYEPFDPELVGARRLLLYGAKTGRKALARKLETLGGFLSAPVLDGLVDVVRSKSAAQGRPFGDNELQQLMAALK